FKGGKIVYIWGTAKAIAIRNTPPVVPPPVIDVLTPPNCREGDVFTVTVINGPPSKLCDIGMLGDHDAVQYQFPSAYIDKNGNATLALRMPYVLDQGISMDGRDIRVKIGTFIKTFHVTLYAGQRIGISSPTVEEGKTLDVKITGGVAESEVTIQITDDNGVAHEYGYMQTDGSGNGTYQIIIPQVLPKGSRIDGYGLRILHDGIVAERKITITEGFRIEVEAQKTREVSANFPLGIRNSTPDATVHVEWYLDDSHRASQTFHTDRNGDADIKVPTPKLITNGADKDTFKMVVTVDGQSGEFEFNMLVLKDTHNAHGAPDDPGDPQVRSTAPVPNRVNSAPGVKINIPASVGVTTQRPIEKSENVAFAAQDPVITVQDRMAHQLVILCYGSGQIYGEIDPNEKNTFYAIAGMDQVYSDINGFISSSHIVRLESGFPNSLHPMEVADSEFHLALTAINSKIVHLKSIGEEVRSVIVAGYSWGGGMAKRIVDAIHQTYTTLEVAGVAYVDAVHHGSIGHETQLPHSPISSFLNIYQSHFSVAEDGVTIGNGHVGNPGLVNVNGLAGYGQYQEIDTDTFAHSTTSHITIDNDESPIVAGFIKRVLNGWFWAHV
ncbi:MAG TPA: hypothetical protein VLG69_04315, partial [Candidatus Andersenbacteria bacterium]|nr:hypothetical protein [Candidatus Andersenbacteria bacterium]